MPGRPRPRSVIDHWRLTGCNSGLGWLEMPRWPSKAFLRTCDLNSSRSLLRRNTPMPLRRQVPRPLGSLPKLFRLRCYPMSFPVPSPVDSFRPSSRPSKHLPDAAWMEIGSPPSLLAKPGSRWLTTQHLPPRHQRRPPPHYPNQRPKRMLRWLRALLIYGLRPRVWV